MHAVLGDQCACGATLVEAGAKLDLTDLTGKSAIIHAVARVPNKSSMFFLELLIASGADLDVRDMAHGWTSLHWAMNKVKATQPRGFDHYALLLSFYDVFRFYFNIFLDPAPFQPNARAGKFWGKSRHSR